MKTRAFSTNSGNRIEASTAEAVSGLTNVRLVLIVRSEIGSAVLDLTPKEATRFAEWIHDVDADVWADEMGECDDHDLTSVRCEKCGRYCGTKKRCPHCAPRSKS
jgi:hypothetical protein